MRLARTALMVLGVVLIVGIAKGAFIFLGIIFALMIPILAILLYSPLGESLSNEIKNSNGSGVSLNEFNQLKDKYDRLENRFNEYEEEMNKMREALIFSDNRKISTSTDSSEEKNKLNKQINLEKTL
jgi:hypothetical protein